MECKNSSGQWDHGFMCFEVRLSRNQHGLSCVIRLTRPGMCVEALVQGAPLRSVEVLRALLLVFVPVSR